LVSFRGFFEDYIIEDALSMDKDHGMEFPNALGTYISKGGTRSEGWLSKIPA
jgi:hypothetical protein